MKTRSYDMNPPWRLDVAPVSGGTWSDERTRPRSKFCYTRSKSLHLQVPEVPNKLGMFPKKQRENLKMSVSICIITSGLC